MPSHLLEIVLAWYIGYLMPKIDWSVDNDLTFQMLMQYCDDDASGKLTKEEFIKGMTEILASK